MLRKTLRKLVKISPIMIGGKVSFFCRTIPYLASLALFDHDTMFCHDSRFCTYKNVKFQSTVFYQFQSFLHLSKGFLSLHLPAALIQFRIVHFPEQKSEKKPFITIC